MDQWRKDAREERIIIDKDFLVPADHLLRKIEKVMDYEWLYEGLNPHYCHDNGRTGTDPVMLIKMVLIQHLFGISSLRQTHREIQVNLAYRWFLGYGVLDDIPHFATVSYAFCKRFPDELTTKIFEHILMSMRRNFETHYSGLAAVTRWVRLKYAAMNLKKLANWIWNNSIITGFCLYLHLNMTIPLFSPNENSGSLTDCNAAAVNTAAALFNSPSFFPLHSRW